MSDSILAQPAPAADQRIAYGVHPLQFGDLRVPDGVGLHPLIIVVHGGFWRAKYDLAYMGHLCAALAVRGVATWNIEYRRIGDDGGGWPNTFLDVAHAADYVRELAPRFALDLTRVIATGHSAGGHLALWLAARHRLSAAHPLFTLDPLALRGVVSLAGVADLHRAYVLRLSQRVVVELLGGSPKNVPERYAAASPAALLPLGVRQILLHGTKDGPVPFEISAEYVQAARAAGDDATLIPLLGAHHFEVVDPTSREWSAVEAALLELLI